MKSSMGLAGGTNCLGKQSKGKKLVLNFQYFFWIQIFCDLYENYINNMKTIIRIFNDPIL